MANRTGIELLPYVCRIVEIQAGGGVWGGKRGRGVTRVRSFHEIPYAPGSPGLLTAALRQIKGLERRASVAVWGLSSRHETFLLPPAAAGDLMAIARREARATPVPSGQTADGIVIGELREAGRREVGYVSVQPDEMRARLQPLMDAGFEVENAVTPGLAHGALLRQRWAPLPDAVTAVLSLNGRATALTVLRGSVVLFAREMPWGHETERAEQAAAVLDPSRFAARLASELRRSFVCLQQHHKVDVTHLLVCGDVPYIRSLTGPLMEELSLEVETLDSPEGLDLSRLLEPADEFRARLASLRTAWSLAADRAAPINLVPREATGVRLVPTLDRRHGMAVLAGLIIAAAGWGLVTSFARNATADQDRLRRQIAVLEPEMQRLSDARRDVHLVSLRLAALRAFASQGPRLAKVLEVFSRAAPEEVAVTDVEFNPAVGAWTLSVKGQAEGRNAAEAQATFNGFLKALKETALLGDPLKPPSLSVKTADPAEEEPPRLVDAGPRDDWPGETAPLPLNSGGGSARPAFTEFVRNGRVYRVPMRRQADRLVDTESERLRRERALREGTRYEQAVLPEEPAADPMKRNPGTVLEFTMHFEVRK